METYNNFYCTKSAKLVENYKKSGLTPAEIARKMGNDNFRLKRSLRKPRAKDVSGLLNTFNANKRGIRNFDLDTCAEVFTKETTTTRKPRTTKPSLDLTELKKHFPYEVITAIIKSNISNEAKIAALRIVL